VKRTLVLSFLALVSALVLAACGSEQPAEPEQALPPPPAEVEEPTEEASFAPLAAAASATTDTGSARMAMVMTMSMAQLPQPMTITAEGAFEFATQRGTMTMDYAQILQAAGTAAPAGTDSLMEIRLDGTTMYMRMPLLEGMLGKPWVKMDLEELAAQQGMSSMFPGGQAATTDPSQWLDLLLGASESVEELGTEEVRDVETTHYRAVLDLDAYGEELPEEERAAYEEAIGQLSGFGLSSLPVDVWVDSDGLIRRYTLDLDVPSSAEVPGGMTMNLALDLYDFGTEVEVEAPPAGQVADFAELMTGALGQG
jgi:hypothetical protein